MFDLANKVALIEDKVEGLPQPVAPAALDLSSFKGIEIAIEEKMKSSEAKFKRIEQELMLQKNQVEQI